MYGYADAANPAGSVVKSPLVTMLAGDVRSKDVEPDTTFRPDTNSVVVPPPGQVATAEAGPPRNAKVRGTLAQRMSTETTQLIDFRDSLDRWFFDRKTDPPHRICRVYFSTLV